MRGTMEVEYRAAVRMVAAPDFIEGVRCPAQAPVSLVHLHLNSLLGSQEHKRAALCFKKHILSSWTASQKKVQVVHSF